MTSQYTTDASVYERYFRNPEKYYMKPFRIFANLWFVGNRNVGSYLLDTKEGLVLIDTTYPTTRDILIQSIWEAGFNPSNIRYILHTHGHFDHFGGTSLLVSLSGAKTFLGAEDAKMFRERPELSLIDHGPYTFAPLFVPDVELQDGDVITLGDVNIRAVSVPGHTLGTMAYFIQLEDQGNKQLAGLYGGVGLNTVCEEFVEKYQVFEYRNCFLSSLEKVKGEPVTITLGNHTSQNKTIEKYNAMVKNSGAPNPFINPMEWACFLEETKQKYLRMIKKEQEKHIRI